MTMTLADDDGPKVTGSLFDDPEFVTEFQGLVDRRAPRVFAVVQERRDPDDVRIVAWGLVSERGAQVYSVGGGMQMSFQAPENALLLFRDGGKAVPRIMWVTGQDRPRER